MIKGKRIKPIRKPATSTPTLSIKKWGRAVLNRAAADLFEGWGSTHIIMYWSEKDLIITIQHGEEQDLMSMKLSKPTRQVPTSSFAAKSLLSVIGWDWNKNQGPFPGEVLDDEQAIEFRVTSDCILS